VAFVAGAVLALLFTRRVALAATFTGTDGRDRIVGTPEADAISVLGANDWVKGRDGDDTISGGKDDVSEGSGADDIYAYGGKDSVSGGSGVNVVKGDYGDDTLFRGQESDALRGEEDDDTLEGGAGGDVLLDGGLGLEFGKHDPNLSPFMFLPPPQLRNLYQRFFQNGTKGTGWAVLFDVDASHETFSGGDGDDHFCVSIEGAGVRDTVDCGAGTDQVFADQTDSVAPDFEEIHRYEVGSRSRLSNSLDVAMKRV
jgi:hypothetical protein